MHHLVQQFTHLSDASSSAISSSRACCLLAVVVDDMSKWMETVMFSCVGFGEFQDTATSANMSTSEEGSALGIGEGTSGMFL